MTAPAAPAAASSLKERAQKLIRRIVGTAPAVIPKTRFPVSPFGDWSFEDAQDALTDAISNSELDSTRAFRETIAPIPDQAVFYDPRALQNQLVINRAFYEGDHWQMGSGWIGPHPQPMDPDYVTAMNELVGAFMSKNVIREVTKRHANGVIGKAPTWSFVPRRILAPDDEPTTEEQAAVDEANRLMTAWWDARKVRSVLHDAVCTLLFATRAPLRLYVPPGLLGEVSRGETGMATVVRAASIEEALGMIWPDHPMPEHAAVVQDDDTKMEAGVRIYESDPEENDRDNPGDDTTASETTKSVGVANDAAPEDAVELVYLDPSGNTIVKLLHDDDEAEDGETYLFDFGARLTMIELRRDALITPQVTQQQRGLNLALSMLPRNVITGGFLERVLLNAQMPGKFEKSADGLTQRFIPDPLHLGAGATNFFAGIKTKDAMGNEVLATPQIQFRDPVPVDSPVMAAHEHYLAILDETAQLHVVLSGDAVVSGKSREQARAEFLASLSDTKPEVDAAARFLLETPLAMAEALSGQGGKLTSLVRVEVSCRLDTGPLNPTDRAANEASVGKTISQQTAMARNGVDDVDAELARMADDPLSRATLAQAQGVALTALTTSGISIELAAEMLDLDPALAKKIADDRAASAFSAAPANNGSVPPAKGTPAKAPASNGDATVQPTGGASGRAGGAS